MDARILYPIKRRLRLWDSSWTRKTREVQFRGEPFRFYSTYWWSDVSQELLESEIAPYFAALETEFSPSVIVDVGAASGHFAILAAKVFSSSVIYAFEPSERQRILLRRNASLNEVENMKIEPIGLWDHLDKLAFRTNGAESSFEPVSRFQGRLTFPEKVDVLPLDQWSREKDVTHIDLIKMDAEGAEIEILNGARTVLRESHPALLIQAYHLRDGIRTLERCAETLTKIGYETHESGVGSGLLCARWGR